MDNNINLLTSVHHQQKKSPRKPNKTKKITNKQPVKVVYISNPMKVKTSASEFRALVQELTGQDAEFPDPSKFPATDDDGSGTGDPTVKMGSGDDDHDDDDGVVVEQQIQQVAESSSTTTTTTTPSTTTNTTKNSTAYDVFDDDVFMPHMMDSLSGILPSTVWYDTPQLDVIRSGLDAIM